MYYLKNTLFLELTKNQKSSLFGFIKSFVKKHCDKSCDDILQLFIEDEQYYYAQNNPHFEWIINEFEKDSFIKELKILINENKKQLDIKEKQKPFLEKQKQLAKEQRKKASEYKMSKEAPTKKQLYYYEKLCKKYNLEMDDTNTLSRLDLKNKISEIIDNEQERAKKIRSDKEIY